MKRLHGLAVIALLAAGATSAAAQGVTLEFQSDGKVSLTAQNVSVSQILTEWSRRGRTTIMNGERVPGPPVTLELKDVTEQQALETVLRGVSGYLVAARENPVSGASSFDRIYILPTSARPTTAAPLAQQPQQQAVQVQDDFDGDDPPPPGPRPPNLPPGARVPPREVTQPPAFANRPPLPVDDVDREQPETRPAPPPANPFGVGPGTNRPGVFTPGPNTPGTPAPAPNTPGTIAPVPNARPNNQ